MLLDNLQIEMFRPKCNPNFQSVHCVAHLDQDISGVLPYLNTAMGGGGRLYRFSPYPYTTDTRKTHSAARSRDIRQCAQG